jgi:hypothetical protein
LTFNGLQGVISPKMELFNWVDDSEIRVRVVSPKSQMGVNLVGI